MSIGRASSLHVDACCLSRRDLGGFSWWRCRSRWCSTWCACSPSRFLSPLFLSPQLQDSRVGSSYSDCWRSACSAADLVGGTSSPPPCPSDKPDDVHSPVQHGFFWSHMAGSCRTSTSPRSFAGEGLLKYPELRFWIVSISWYDNSRGRVFLLGVFSTCGAGLGTNGWQMLVWDLHLHRGCLSRDLYHQFLVARFRAPALQDRRCSRNNCGWRSSPWRGWHNNIITTPRRCARLYCGIRHYILHVEANVVLRRDLDLKPVPAAVRKGDGKRF